MKNWSELKILIVGFVLIDLVLLAWLALSIVYPSGSEVTVVYRR